jgi:23S rRNA A2030 N6-methylase RlmJ
MMIINPPFEMDIDLKDSLFEMSRLMDDGGSNYSIRWLKAENAHTEN